MKNSIQNINTLVDFIVKIQNNSYSPNFTYFFRGHADKEYKLQPSIYRNTGYIQNEDTMFRELITHNTAEFSQCKGTIDYLVKMQHYGLPTRLLDLTTNPLIALFFACISRENEEGEVIVFKVPNKSVKYSDSDTVSVLSNIARMEDGFKYEDLNSKVKFNRQPSIQLLLHEIKQEKNSFRSIIEKEHLKSVVCIKAKMDNPRITNQSGAFFLFGCGNKDKESVNINTDWIASKERILIENKNAILDELKFMGITEKFVYPNLEKYTDFLRSSYYVHPDEVRK